jgi:hypothetical protein
LLLRQLVREEKGQILPYIAFTILIIITVASYALSTSVMFLERKKVEDALDTALLSAALAAVKEVKVPTNYSDDLVKHCTKWEERTRKYTYTDDEGNVVEDYYTYRVCVDWYHEVVEEKRGYKNYIYATQATRSIIEDYFFKNLHANSKGAIVRNLDVQITYDDERYLNVKKELKWLDPPAYHSDGKPIYGRSYNPDWWPREFGDYGKPEPFTTTKNEENRIVRFPRWVKISATAEVEIPSPMATLIGGKKTIVLNLQSEVVQELLQVDRPSSYNIW